VNTPNTRYDKEKIDGHKLEIKRMFSTLTTPGSALDEKLSASAHASHPAPVDPHDTTTSSASKSGTSSALSPTFADHARNVNCSLIIPSFLTSTPQLANV